MMILVFCASPASAQTCDALALNKMGMGFCQLQQAESLPCKSLVHTLLGVPLPLCSQRAPFCYWQYSLFMLLQSYTKEALLVVHWLKTALQQRVNSQKTSL